MPEKHDVLEAATWEYTNSAQGPPPEPFSPKVLRIRTPVSTPTAVGCGILGWKNGYFKKPKDGPVDANEQPGVQTIAMLV